MVFLYKIRKNYQYTLIIINMNSTATDNTPNPNEEHFRQNIVKALEKLFEKELSEDGAPSTRNTAGWTADALQNNLHPSGEIALTYFSETKLKKNGMFINLERSVYNYAIQEATSKNIIKKWENRYFLRIYVDRLRSIYTNLSNHAEFRKKILNGEITFEQLSKITHQEMCPDMWNDLIQMKIKRDESKYKNRIEANTDVYVCKKCRSRKCVYCAVQTRSADEQMSIFVSCLDCGANWKN